MAMRKVVIADLLNCGDVHREFNEQVIDAKLRQYQDGTGVFHKSVEYVKARANLKIVWSITKETSTYYYRWVGIIGKLFRLVLGFERTTPIFIMHLPPMALFLLCILNFFLRRDVNVYLHGELRYLVYPLGAGQKIGAVFLKLALQENLSGVKKICLSKGLRENLSEEVKLSELLVTFRPEAEMALQSKGNFNYDCTAKIVLMTGVISAQKGALFFNRLAKSKLAENGYRLRVEGKFDPGIGARDFDLSIDVSEHKSFVPQSEYEDLLERACAVFIPQIFCSGYELVYSGMLETCLRFGIPIITKRTAELSALEDKCGRIGVLLGETEELENVPLDLLSPQNLKMYNENICRL